MNKKIRTGITSTLVTLTLVYGTYQFTEKSNFEKMFEEQYHIQENIEESFEKKKL
jgi:hypothetical protein